MNKFIILCASVAAASCAFVDVNEQLKTQLQHQQEMRQLQSEQIREHQELQHQQRQDQMQQLIDARRVQEQFIRDQEQERVDRINDAKNHHHHQQVHHGHRVFWPHHHRHTPALFHVQPTIVNIPSSTRHFNAHDNANYNFAYAVSDMTTGDIKSHEETKVGDQVRGHYTMMDSDGFHRTVNYRADDVHGFDAHVHREPAHAALVFNNHHHAGHHRSHQHHHASPNAVFFTATHPRSTATTQISRVDDGAHSNVVTSTTNF